MLVFFKCVLLVSIVVSQFALFQLNAYATDIYNSKVELVDAAELLKTNKDEIEKIWNKFSEAYPSFVAIEGNPKPMKLSDVLFYKFDFNDDGFDDYMFMPFRSPWCGASNCAPIFYIYDDVSKDFIAYNSWVSFPPLDDFHFLKSLTNGFHSIQLHNGLILNFCGENTPPSDCDIRRDN